MAVAMALAMLSSACEDTNEIGCTCLFEILLDLLGCFCSTLFFSLTKYLIVVPYTWSLKYLVPLVDLKSKSMSKTIENVQKPATNIKKLCKTDEMRKQPKIAKTTKTTKTADFSLSHFQRRRCHDHGGGGAAAAAIAAAAVAAAAATAARSR